MRIGINISTIASQAVGQVNAELPSRAIMASHILKNSSQEVLGHEGGGRTYRKPAGGTYQASSPGSPPAMRTGTLMTSWRPVTNGINPALEGGTPYAGFMQYGTPGGKIAARPFEEKIIEMSEPQISQIYSAPFNIKIT